MAETAPEKRPLPEQLKLNFPGYGSLTFSTLEEIGNFLREERKAWDQMPARIQNVPGALHVGMRTLMERLNNVEQVYNDYLRHLNAPDSSQNIEQHRHSSFENLKNHLHNLQGLPYLHSKAASAQLVLSKLAADPVLAHAGLTLLVMPRNQLQQPNLPQIDVRTVPEAVLYLSFPDAVEAAAATDAALTNLQKSWSDRLADQQKKFEAAIADWAAIRADIEKQIEEKRAELEKRQAECDQQIVEFKAAIDAINAHYREQMLLKAPAEYWDLKYKGHNARSWWLFSGLALVVVVIIGGSLIAAPYILGLMKDTLGATAGSGWVGEIALITVPALAAFWLLRAISRLFVQQTQRMGDALERNTMVKTYLALLTEPNHKVEPAERLVILQALFRPGPDDPPDTEGQAGMLDALHKLTK